MRVESLDEMWPAAWHRTDRYANNRVESDHAQLKRQLRPMRGIKTMTGLRTLAAGHSFVRTCAAATTRSPPNNPATVGSPWHSANSPRQSERLHWTIGGPGLRDDRVMQQTRMTDRGGCGVVSAPAGR
jgi:hypothetical protein